MNIGDHIIGVCSWSLRPKSMTDLVHMLVRQLEIGHVQLALSPLLAMDESEARAQFRHLRAEQIVITAGMISYPGENYSSIEMIRNTGGWVPDAQWPERRLLTIQAAKFAGGLPIRQISTHIGFVPPAENANYAVMVQRVREMAKVFADQNLGLLLETGQEPASHLRRFLEEVGATNVFVNFDPANMILYGAGDPLEAISVLGAYIRHVHVKDARRSAQPGVAWGTEVPFGQGEVDPEAFLKTLKSVGYAGPLVVEREGGARRVDDVLAAVDVLKRAAGRLET